MLEQRKCFLKMSFLECEKIFRVDRELKPTQGWSSLKRIFCSQHSSYVTKIDCWKISEFGKPGLQLARNYVVV